MSVQHLVWLPRVVVACVCVHPGGRTVPKSGAQLLFYPRYHLDNSSLLARYPLEQARLLASVGSLCRSTCMLYSAMATPTLLSLERVMLHSHSDASTFKHRSA